jgi:type II secretory pathway predicted ATPase ExeA
MHTDSFVAAADGPQVAARARPPFDAGSFGKARRDLGQALLGGTRVCVLSGAAGLGKTTVLRALVQDLAATDMTSRLILCHRWRTIDEMLPERDVAHPGRWALLLDEAQHLEPATLAALLRQAVGRGVPVLVAGQPDLEAATMEALPRVVERHDVVVRRLRPWSAAEVAHFITANGVAGDQPENGFTEAAVAEIARRSGGVPWLINRLTATSRFLAELAGETHVDAPLIAEAAARLDVSRDPLQATPETDEPPPAPASPDPDPPAQPQPIATPERHATPESNEVSPTPAPPDPEPPRPAQPHPIVMPERYATPEADETPPPDPEPPEPAQPRPITIPELHATPETDEPPPAPARPDSEPPEHAQSRPFTIPELRAPFGAGDASRRTAAPAPNGAAARVDCRCRGRRRGTSRPGHAGPDSGRSPGGTNVIGAASAASADGRSGTGEAARRRSPIQARDDRRRHATAAARADEAVQASDATGGEGPRQTRDHRRSPGAAIAAAGADQGCRAASAAGR